MTAQAYRLNAELRHPETARLLWWGGIPLDRQPPNTHHKSDVTPGEPAWDAASVDYFAPPPSALVRAFGFVALPAFLIGMAITGALGTYGVNEAATFLIVMPLLVVAWFYFLGWLIERRRRKRSAS